MILRHSCERFKNERLALEALGKMTGDISALAMEIGVSASYLLDVRKGRRPISSALALKLSQIK